MTAERRKALLFLIVTLVIGILIGSLVPGMYGRMRREGGREKGKVEQRGERRPDRRMGFQRMIYRITQADSAQRLQIQPILDETSAKIETLEKESNGRMTGIMDSMKIKLQPILNQEQIKKLEDYSQKTRSRRKGH